MYTLKIFVTGFVGVCLVGCSAMSDGMSMAASLSEKPADAFAARQGTMNASVQTADCKSCL